MMTVTDTASEQHDFSFCLTPLKWVDFLNFTRFLGHLMCLKAQERFSGNEARVIQAKWETKAMFVELKSKTHGAFPLSVATV